MTSKILIPLLTLLFACPCLQAESSTGRPNILLIVADDMGFSDISSYGSEIETPNLDRLAAKGIRYTQFYNAARCCPTRASLLTGLYPHQTGIGNMVHDQGSPAYRGDLNESSVTVAQVLKESGYRTFLSGKWHLTKHTDMFRDDIPKEERRYVSKHNWPVQRGFEEFFGTIHGAGSFFEPTTLVQGNEPVEEIPQDFYYTDAISEHAVETIARFAVETPETPFFGYIAYTAPHWPLHAKDEDIERFKGKYDVGWDVVRERRLNRIKLLGLLNSQTPLSERDEKVPAWEDEEEKDYYAHCMAVYAAQIHSMDLGIGLILKSLEDAGLLDNTIVLFLSDNGGCAEVLSEKWPESLHVPYTTNAGSPVYRGFHKDHLPGPVDTYASYGVGWANASNTPFTYYKHYIQEGGIATPLIVNWPKGIAEKIQGTITGQIGHVKDLMPTFLELADVSYPEVFGGSIITPTEGTSLVPNLRGETVEVGTIFWEHHGNRGVREGDWKIVSMKNGPWALYNMRLDRLESEDLGEAFPAKATSLARQYEAWAEKVGVIKNPPKPPKR